MGKDSALTDRQAFWLRHLRACGKGSLKAYAEAHGLDLRAMYDAKARLKRKGALGPAPARLVRVECAPARTSPPTLCRVHLRNGIAVEVACAPADWGELLARVAALP